MVSDSQPPSPAVSIQNPFRPGAGHRPPYLAGRNNEMNEMRGLLDQKEITQNLVLTGLRGVGKTVLLDAFKPIAQEKHWLWATNDVSEATSETETNLCIRILTDIAQFTSSFTISESKQLAFGFASNEEVIQQPLSYKLLSEKFDQTPGLVSDKLKACLEFVWSILPHGAVSGIAFAYDEAQNLADHAEDKQYPLALLLDVFQSIQRRGIPFMLVLTGLPTLPTKLIDSRTFAERMFHTIFLKRLDDESAREAIVEPIKDENCPIDLSDDTVNRIIQVSGGYPYFIQFICKEVFDVWIAQLGKGTKPSVPESEILRKLDADFFHGRWAKATDRQRDLLQVIATLPTAESEFGVQEVVEGSKMSIVKPFNQSHVSKMLKELAEAGLVYKYRHGKYSLAVPLMSQFIQRQTRKAANLQFPASSNDPSRLS
jgi:hypothetical protein